MNELYALLGFLAGLVAALFAERGKETRKRISLIRVVEWQLEAFIDACEWAVRSKILDSSGVENFAAFIVQTFQRQPELIVAAHRSETRRALWDAYAEASGTLGLIALYREQVTAKVNPTALDGANYEGLIRRSRDALHLLKKARWWLYFAG